MRALSSAQVAYSGSCGWGYYAQTMEDLALAPPGGNPFIGPELATTGIVKANYMVAMGSDALAPIGIPPTCNGGVAGTGYHATAVPLAGAGEREFGTNTIGSIYFTVLPAAIAITDYVVGTGDPLR
jgi:hypothetical protein